MNDNDKELIALGLESYKNKKIDEFRHFLKSFDNINFPIQIDSMISQLTEIKRINTRLENEFYNE